MIVTLTATEARAKFPHVVGTIRGAELFPAFSVVDIGPLAFAVLDDRDEVRGVCPTRTLAHRAGARIANEATVRS